jgi:hypothetical protein
VLSGRPRLLLQIDSFLLRSKGPFLHKDGVDWKGADGEFLRIWLGTAHFVEDELLDVALDLLLDLVKLLQLIGIVGVKLIGSLPLEGIRHHLFRLRLVLLRVVEFFERVDCHALVVLVLAEDIFFLNDFLVVDEVVVGVVEVEVSITAFSLFADCAGSLHVALFHNLFIEFTRYIVELCLFFSLGVERSVCA